MTPRIASRRASRGRPCVVIFSGGLRRSETTNGGWEAVFVTDAGRVAEGGEFRDPCTDALAAEVKAAANALAAAARRGLLDARPVVLLQIDSAPAIGVILASNSARYFYSRAPHDRDSAPVKPTWVPVSCTGAVVKIRDICKVHGIDLVLRRAGLPDKHRSIHEAELLAPGGHQMRML